MKLIEVETLQEVRLNGIDEPAGKIVEIDESLVPIWIERGLAKLPGANTPPTEDNPVTDESAPPAEDNLVTDNAEDEIKQYHVGGGWYQLPNGEKIQGKEEALEVLAALKASEGGGANESQDNKPTE